MKLSERYLQRFQVLHPVLIDLSLGRVERLLAKLGHPQAQMKRVIHVAGTNGKGSTIAFLRAMLEAKGARVNVFTSPHLISFHERIRLGATGGGALVDEETLVAAFERVEAVNAGDPITFFEITTAVAFDLFARNNADFNLIEVGLGGRLDATNVFTKPTATIITPISLDHKELLGDTIAKIAAEKAGILKKGAITVFAEQAPEALEVLMKQARRLRLSPLVYGQDFRCYEEHGHLIYQGENELLDLPLPRLLGAHQFVNAASAIAALQALLPQGEITASHFAVGLQKVEWPARLQRLTGQLAELLPAGSELWLDGGHNEDGARVLAESMAMLEEKSSRPLILMAATMARKDATTILAPFLGLAQEFYALPMPQAQSEHARSPAEMVEKARILGLPAAQAGSVEESLRFIAARAWHTPPRVLITGSLYLAGDILARDGMVLK